MWIPYLKYTSIHVLNMSYFYEYITLNSSISLIIFNICVYIFLTLGIFSSILLVVDKSYSTLNKFKQIQEYYFLFIFVLVFLLSLAGVPPLLGFLGKFLLYIQLLAYKSYYLFLLFLLFNIFILYFYIQNVRFMISKNTNKTTSSFFLSNTIYESIFFFLIIVMFFNLFGILYFDNFLVYINY